MATRKYRTMQARESYKRPVLATLHRGGNVVWVRHYRRLQNGIRRAVELALEQGQPKDVVEFALASGAQLGTVKLQVGGLMSVKWTELGHVEKLIEELEK